MLSCCLPFLTKVNTQDPQVSIPASPPMPKEVEDDTKEDPRSPVDVILRQPLRIPDALMNIGNPTIKAAFKKFCKDNHLCIACAYANPDSPMVLVFNGILYECPHCDSDVDSP